MDTDEKHPAPIDDPTHPYRRGPRNPASPAAYGESRRWVSTFAATEAGARAAYEVLDRTSRVHELEDPWPTGDGRWLVRFLVVMCCHNKGNHTSDAAHVTAAIDRLPDETFTHEMEAHTWEARPYPDPFCPRRCCGRDPDRALDYVRTFHPELVAGYEADLLPNRRRREGLRRWLTRSHAPGRH